MRYGFDTVAKLLASEWYLNPANRLKQLGRLQGLKVVHLVVRQTVKICRWK
jgi:hypothetical protein